MLLVMPPIAATVYVVVGSVIVDQCLSIEAATRVVVRAWVVIVVRRVVAVHVPAVIIAVRWITVVI